LEPPPFTVVVVLSCLSGLLKGLIWALSGSWGCGHEASQTAPLFSVVMLRKSLEQATLGLLLVVYETCSYVDGFHFVWVCFRNPFGFGCSILYGLVLWLFWNSRRWVVFQTVLERAKALGSWPASGWSVVVILLFVVSDGDAKLIDSVLADNFTCL